MAHLPVEFRTSMRIQCDRVRATGVTVFHLSPAYCAHGRIAAAGETPRNECAVEVADTEYGRAVFLSDTLNGGHGHIHHVVPRGGDPRRCGVSTTLTPVAAPLTSLAIGGVGADAGLLAA